MKTFTRLFLSVAIATSLSVCPIGAAESEVVVVLSSNLKPYQEALQGVDDSLKKNVVVLSDKPPDISSRCRVVIAMGGKAAVADYPDHVVLIYWAPGLRVSENRYKGGAVKIHTGAELNSVVRRIQLIQPSLQRLAAVWMTPSVSSYVERSKQTDAPAVDIKGKNIAASDEMPEYLRGLKGDVDALLLMPDPALFTRENIAMIKEYSWANGLPFYVPVDGLLEQGAVASISVPFIEIGKSMSEAASKALSGAPLPKEIFPSKINIGLNLTAAQKCRIDFSPDIRGRAERVLP